MKVDFKITTWERVEIPEEHEQKVLDGLKSGKIQRASDIWELLDRPDELVAEPLYEVDKQMTVEQNGGEATIEAIAVGENGKDEIIYENSNYENTLIFNVAVSFNDKITDDKMVGEVAKNIAYAIKDATNNMGIAPDDSDTFTTSVEVSNSLSGINIREDIV